MMEVLRTNDLVLLSFVEAVLKDMKIECIVVDEHMSVLDGSIGVLPRRLLIEDDEFHRAKLVLSDPDIHPHLNSELRSKIPMSKR